MWQVVRPAAAAAGRFDDVEPLGVVSLVAEGLFTILAVRVALLLGQARLRPLCKRELIVQA